MSAFFSPSVFPFSSLSNRDFLLELRQNYSVNICANIKNLLIEALNVDKVNSFDAKYYTPEETYSTYKRLSKELILSVFHINIRSLNANYDRLCSVLTSLSFEF